MWSWKITWDLFWHTIFIMKSRFSHLNKPEGRKILSERFFSSVLHEEHKNCFTMIKVFFTSSFLQCRFWRMCFCVGNEETLKDVCDHFKPLRNCVLHSMSIFLMKSELFVTDMEKESPGTQSTLWLALDQKLKLLSQIKFQKKDISNQTCFAVIILLYVYCSESYYEI